ncbi:putative Alcohol dehydrogenase superfamily protein [Vibrio nigripulchritudo SFn27]|uniref:Putative Alcohol dehydrogenase superfamily protein n=1 Tax=Vibrio nigripulchritudo TaxID=28173 RepID=U4K8F8_9VIBR|nr:NADP-dependent oxidoreductase [Vibrio nigripulchritudo]CCN84680.1 putative Alcohol dehydrogenase superfamily protein [Vibrio nigripulchritudo BLFn1]CCN86867.1 putative Alcohol dehydrogenase superfamily protein [Vibrio nigripulchritudo SFn27]CCN93095.1 putative Alcohol dehydrogenase superfamily protein [Vibrio nigripulchritudo ENn2]CCO39470.1 putative Alcohol dehydrogenase superfamily protein [Vibrio nigripulchritudo SFn135]CCO53731.1 putative Alcohol dehydrogenase superfamily protein [Vibri
MTDNKKVVITQFGETDVLAIQSEAIPEPAEGEVLVKVHFAGVNPIDVKTRKGLGWAAEANKDNLPWTPGYDISGVVEKCGTGTNTFEVGNFVAGLVGFPADAGGYSQYICVKEDSLSLVPDSVTLEAAAVLPVAGQTAAQALNLAGVTANDRVLILAGAGGVGHLAVQIAVAAQAEVFTTCGEDNLDYLATLGAHAINYQFSPVSERVEDVDVLIDLVGGDAALDALKCLKDNARVVTVPTITADLICEKAKMLGFEATGMLVEPDIEQMDTMLYMVGVGILKTEVQQIFPYTDVAKAHDQVETGHTRGKILLDMKC